MHISINQVNREILSPPECCGAYSLARVEQQQKYLIKSIVKLCVQTNDHSNHKNGV